MDGSDRTGGNSVSISSDESSPFRVRLLSVTDTRVRPSGRVSQVSPRPCANSAITQGVNVSAVSASWGWPSLLRVSVWRKLGVRAALPSNPPPEVGIPSARQRRRHQGIA